jgi:hypothetical protein
MVLATPADWVLAYNEKTLKDLCSDSGTPIADLTTNPRVLRFLDIGAGHVIAACVVSGIYSTDDLEEIANTSGPTQSLMKGLVCKLALIEAMEKNPEKFASESLAKIREQTEEYLDQLRNGKRLFVVPSNPTGNSDAGTPQCDGMTTMAILNRNGLPTRVRNYYPNAAQRQPRNRQI